MRRSPIALLAALALTGCSNPVDVPGFTDITGLDPNPDDRPPPGVCAPPVSRARRLSHVELEHALAAAFPTIDLPSVSLVPDPRPSEFNNDVDALQPNSLWMDQVHNLAIGVAERVVADDTALPCDPAVDTACVDLVIEEFATRAFRRAPSDEERADLRSFFEEAPGLDDFDAGLTLAVEYIVQSPGFLYRIDAEGPAGPAGQRRVDAASLASRLSFFLWGSAPDEELLNAALSGQLETAEQIQAQVTRMLDTEAAREEALSFHAQWLDFRRLVTTTKAPGDNFSDSLKDALITEQDLFVLEHLFGENRPVADLLTTRQGYVNAELANLYGVPAPDNGEWALVELPADRAGFLRRAPFLASHAHPNNPSPVLRGVFILDRFLCTELGTPPGEADVTPPAPGGDATTNREAVEQRTAPQNCQTCHSIINPLGFAFENYDTVGRVRAQDNGVDVDTSGVFVGRAFNDTEELIGILQDTGELERCAVRKMLTYAWGNTEVGQDNCLVDAIQGAAQNGGVKDLLVAVATHESFRAFVPGPVDDAAAEESP